MTQTAGSCNATGGASEYVGGITSIGAQQAQHGALLTNTSSSAGGNLVAGLQTGGRRRNRKTSKRGGGGKLKYGGTGFVEIIVPAGLLYANQTYKPKGAANLYSRSNRFSKSRRYTRNNRRSSRR